ncbi:DUF4465 domain-containing protein [Tamlana sp. s12]|uniref:DUF4465 domain-containing protein n=1 Tax=Tamlana sp. s12 TaxID=1630406 RepID=UPI0007FF8BF7|nr:DUF4465 domain-containing protein [Tamlana sp. s12]OBQ55572.1 hypothetical protein VQ01_09010 [Tamlana sp. s12]QQY83754.1 DUF4465 domain-containing protein [Tamlana sp. s12]
MKFKPKYIVAIISLGLLFSCEEELELLVPYPNDITFNELTLGRFTFKTYNEPFVAGDNESGIITANAVNTGNGTHSGFALSNQNLRSYPWYSSPKFAPTSLSETEKQQSIDSSAYSVYTYGVNRTENYLVGNTTGDNAYFTLEKPGVVEHVLVANTSYNYLLMQYGSVYSGTIDSQTQTWLINGNPVKNPNIPNTSTDYYATFRLPSTADVEAVRLSGHVILEKRKVGEIVRAAVLDSGGTEAEGETAYKAAYKDYSTGYLKLTMEGYLNGNKTGEVDEYLALKPGVDPVNPEYNFTLNDWRKVDLTSLGQVDKVLFKMSSSYVDAQGKMIYPTLFCLDGIRLSK